MKRSLFLFAALLALAACNNNAPEKSTADILGIDSSIKPGDNFFMYVNHKWYDTAQIPPSQAGVGAYMFMNYPQRLRLQGILDSVSKANNPAGSIEQKIGDFFASGMDTATINQL
ncbi:MAG: lipoprotein, partial [Bacteroidetes bacterium]|nr:lipoprotein [Bacteroidota bacterium]